MNIWTYKFHLFKPTHFWTELRKNDFGFFFESYFKGGQETGKP